MNKTFLFFIIAFGAIAAPTFAQHQHANPPPVTIITDEPKRAKPLSNMALKTGSALSPLARYQRFSLDEPLTDWLVANKTVRDNGGWREYAKASRSRFALSALDLRPIRIKRSTDPRSSARLILAKPATKS